MTDKEFRILATPIFTGIDVSLMSRRELKRFKIDYNRRMPLIKKTMTGLAVNV